MTRLWVFSVLIVLSAWLISSFLPLRKPPHVNYDSMVFFEHDINSNQHGPLYLLPNTTRPDGFFVKTNLLQPSTKEEIVHIVKSIAAETKGGGLSSRRIRVIGSGHSWSTVAKSDDLQLSLIHFKGLVGVDKSNQVTVLAGTTLSEVNIILEEHGLAMSQLGSVSTQTVAGAIATGTHGSGIGFGNLASLVTKIELVTGRGEILTLSANDSNTDLFKAAQVSIGLLGIVTEVTFQCESAFNLAETREVMTLQTCLNDMHTIIHSAQYVKMWVEVFSDSCAVFRTNRTTEGPRGNDNHGFETFVNHAFEVIINIFSWFPSFTPNAMRLLFKYGDPFPPIDRVNSSYKVFNIPHYFPMHNEAELIVDVDECAPAIGELKRLVVEERIPLNYVTEIRFVKADDIWLSPNYHRDSCHLTLCICNPSKRNRLHYFNGLYRSLTDLGLNPRVHWGKYFRLTPTEVASMYPKLKNFLSVRETLDPQGIFLTDELMKTFRL